jgi:hypothetical protein
MVEEAELCLFGGLCQGKFLWCETPNGWAENMYNVARQPSANGANVSRPRVIYVGDRESPEFAEPLRWLAARANVLFTRDVESVVEAIKVEQDPLDLVIVAQLRPGEYTHSSFDSLRCAAPFAPIVCLLASYCQGETRTGRPWPGAPRIYAHQFIARVGQLFERLERQGAWAWGLPFTKTEEDRLLESSPICERRSMARVAVFSDQRESASALCDLLRIAGCTVVDQSGDDVDVAIWDCQGDFLASQSSFERLVERWPRAANIVLMGFSRVADRAAALTCGAAAVVSKPFLVDDLLWQMRQCIVQHRHSLQSAEHGQLTISNMAEADR